MVDVGYIETDPLGLKTAPSSSPSQQKLSVELSSPTSTVAVSPAGAEGEPEAGAGGGTTAAGAAAGAGARAGGGPPCPLAEGVEPEEDPRLPPLTSMSFSPSSPRSGHLVGWCFSFPLQKAQ